MQNSGIEPEQYSARATAASLPEQRSNPYNKFKTLILSLVFKPKREPPVFADFFEIVTISSKLQFSKIIVAVIILVVEAILAFVYSFSPIKTFLLFLSNTTYERALILKSFPKTKLLLK